VAVTDGADKAPERAGCVPTVVGGQVVLWQCYGDLEERYWDMLAKQQEAEYEVMLAEWERERAVEDNETLRGREPGFWEERAETDPYWPPPEVDAYEVQEPEVIG